MLYTALIHYPFSLSFSFPLLLLLFNSSSIVTLNSSLVHIDKLAAVTNTLHDEATPIDTYTSDDTYNKK